MSDNTVVCEYVATAEEPSVGHTDAEVVEANVVTCTADASRVVRPAGRSIQLGADMPRQKMVVCEAHGAYLVGAEAGERPDNARNWEFDAMEPEQVVEE
jgi:hypothetical protein